MENAKKITLQHLAVIMDGNRRWAKNNALEVFLGHSRGGVDAAKCTIEFCLRNGITYLSLYAFSQENNNRSDQEKNFIFDLIITQAKSFLDNCRQHHIRITFVGDRSLFPSSTINAIHSIEQETAQYETLQVAILFYYGARQEIVSAAQKTAQYIQDHNLSISEITTHLFEKMLWTSPFPFPELIIRTGKVQRLSNFLLYQAAYSELCFLDILWPEITSAHLQKAIDDFYETKRNFGK